MSELEHFGNGHMDLQGIDLQGTTPEEQAKYFGLRVGCPIVPRLIEKRGADEMSHRYAEMLLYFQLVLDEVKMVRPDIASQIEGPLKRQPGESLAVYDESWISPENLPLIPGPETPLGFALPRLITAYIESNTKGAGKRMSQALIYFEETLSKLHENDGANALLLKFAERLIVKGHADPLLIVRRTLSQGKMEQDSLYTDFKQIIRDMKHYAPRLSKAYNSLDKEDKKKLGIANPFLK